MRSATVCWCGLLLVGLVSSEKGLSQVQAGVAVGDRVRYWDATGQGAIRASLVRVRNDTVTFKLENDSVVYIPRAQITRLEVSTGRYRSAAWGAAFGLGAGVLVGSIGGALSGHKDGICQCINTGQNMGTGAFIAGIVGVVSGAAIGAPRDEWTNLPLASSGTSIVAATGPRIRLTFGDRAHSTATTGWLLSADSLSVILRNGETGALRTVPRSAIRSSELSVGRARHKRAGLLLGFVGGAALGAGVSAISQPRKPAGDDYRGYDIAATGVLAALAGSVIGAIIGSQVRTEVWESFDIPIRRDPP